MRCLAAMLVLLALAGCGDRRTFDERYEDTGAKIEERARVLDEKIANEQQGAENFSNAS